MLAAAFVAVIAITPSMMANRSFYGEPCNRTVKCDSATWLGCHEGSCWCLKPNEMLFDVSLSKCVSKAGERCKYALDTRDEDDNLIFEVTPCVQNATCSTEGICTCDPHFHENITGLCTYSQMFSQPCDSELRCSLYQGLECHEGTCKCKSGTSTYSENEDQCVGLATKPCVNGKCVANSVCDETENICRCSSGNFKDESNYCQPKLGPLQNCSSEDQCDKKPGLPLLCVHGICDCNPNVSTYATAQRAERYRYDPDIFTGFIGPAVTQCVGLAGEMCLDRLCVPRAFCSYSIIVDFSGICKCLPGYKATKRGRCGHDYHEACTTGDSCFDGFVCKDKKCSCPYENQEYDTYAKICYSKIGGPCGEGVPCGRNAMCSQLNESHSSGGHCVCQEKFVENADGECEVAYGGACDVSSDCDSIAQLECINSICQCGGFAKYSKEDRKCRGLVGARCNYTTEDDECVRNSYCRKIHPLLKGICTCRMDFIETSEYECIRR